MIPLRPVARILAWLAGAGFAAVSWYAGSVYALHNFDHAYGPTATFQIASVFAVGIAIIGGIGYASAVAVYGSRQSLWVAAAAGIVFSLVAQFMFVGLSFAFPNGTPGLLAALIALILGALTIKIHRTNEA